MHLGSLNSPVHKFSTEKDVACTWRSCITFPDIIVRIVPTSSLSSSSCLNISSVTSAWFLCGLLVPHSRTPSILKRFAFGEAFGHELRHCVPIRADL